MWETATNVLAVRLDHLGDVLMTTPAIRALAAGPRPRRVTLLTSPAGAEAAALIPEVSDVLIYDAPWMKATAPRADSAPEFAMIARLRERRFDAAAIFTVFSQNPMPTAMLCYLADIPLRLAHCHENTYQLLTDWVPDPEPGGGIRHEVRRQLDLVATVGGQTADERLSLQVPQAARARVRRLLAERGIRPDRPWLVLHPGASAPSRRYPATGFAAVARRLAAEAGWQIVLTGSADERDLVAAIETMAGIPAVTFVGDLDLGELAALIEAAPLLLSNNTGPAHIAAAVGTPVVDLYALTNPQHTPWGVPSRVLSHDVPCKNCFKSVCPMGHHDCLRRVTPEAVVAAVLDLYAAAGTTRRRAATPGAGAPAAE